MQAIAVVAVSLTTTPLIVINENSFFTQGSIVVKVIAQNAPIAKAKVVLIDKEKKKYFYITNNRGYATPDGQIGAEQREISLDSGSYQLEVETEKFDSRKVKVFISEGGFTEKIVKLNSLNTPPVPVTPKEIYLKPFTKYLLNGAKSYDPDYPDVDDVKALEDADFQNQSGTPNGKRIESYTWSVEEEPQKGQLKILTPTKSKTYIKVGEKGVYKVMLKLSDGIDSRAVAVKINCDYPVGRIKSLPRARAGHSSSKVDGKAILIGGWNKTFLNTVDEFDFYQNKWTAKKPLKISRNHHVSFELNGQIYVVGGHNSVQKDGISTVEKYNYYSDTWTQVSPMPTPRYNLDGGLYDGKFYAFGGKGGKKKLEVYDPAFNTWEKKQDMPIARFRHSATLLNGKFYLIGGKGTANMVQEYDPEEGTWKIKRPMPIPRYYHVSIVLNKKIYVIGGSIPGSNTGVDGISEYDPEKDKWETLSTLPKPIDIHSMNIFDNKIYIFGGEGLFGTTSVLNSAYTYNPLYAKITEK